MNTRTTHSAALALGLALAFGTPAAAEAATYCVKGPCGVNLQTHPGLGQAIAAAAANPGKDRIEIGYGSLAGVNVTVQKGNQVDIVGPGRASTTLIGAADLAQPVIKVADPASTVSALKVRMGSGASGGGLSLSAGDVSNVEVVDGPSNAPTTAGAGVALSPGTRLKDSRVVIADSTSAGLTAVAASATPGHDSAVDGTEISGPTGLAAFGTGTVRARRDFVFESGKGVTSRTTDGELRLMNSVVEVTRGQNPTALSATNAVTGSKPTLVVRGVTAVSSAPGSYGVSATSATDDVQATVSVQDSVLYGFDQSLVRNASKGSASIGISFSNYDPNKVAETGAGGIMAGGNLNVDPGFQGPKQNDYSLKPSSPLIDAGYDGSFDLLDGNVDLGLHDRLVDGNGDGEKRLDMGAYEFQPPAPQQQQQGQGGQQANHGGIDPVRGSDLVGPKLSAASLSTKRIRRGSRRPVTVRFGLSEKARVEIRLDRRVGRTWKPVRLADVQFPLAAGANRVVLSGKLRPNGLKAGSYRVSMFARDANANGSNSVLLPFRVVAKAKAKKGGRSK